MAEQDYSRWAAFGGGPPAKKQVAEAVPSPQFNPTFQDGPNAGMPMYNSAEQGPLPGLQAPNQFDQPQPMQNMRERFDPPGPPQQGFWSALNSARARTSEMGEAPRNRMDGYQPDRGIGKNWGQSVMQQSQGQMNSYRRPTPRKQPATQRSQGFGQMRQQYGQPNQSQGSRASRPAYAGMTSPNGWENRLAAPPKAQQESGSQFTLDSREERASRNSGFNPNGYGERGDW